MEHLDFKKPSAYKNLNSSSTRAISITEKTWMNYFRSFF